MLLNIFAVAVLMAVGVVVAAAIASAVIARWAASAEVSGLEQEELECAGCFWENYCNHEDGMKLCLYGTNGWEDAPWEKC